MDTEITIIFISAIIGLIGIVITEYNKNKRLEKELKMIQEKSEKDFQLKQQEMAFKQMKQVEDAKLKNEKIKSDNVKSIFSFLRNLR